MCGGPRVQGRRRRCLLREVGGEALVPEQDGHVDDPAELVGEGLGLARLLAPLAAERERVADDHLLRVFFAHELRELLEPGVAAHALDDAERSRNDSGRVGHRDTRARRAVVERHHLHASTSATALRPASSASRRPPGFLPPASASVGLPPPPPPMCDPSARTSCTASRPFATSDSSRFTTRKARPSSLDAMTAPAAFSCWRRRSERSRSGPPFSVFASTKSTSPSRPTISNSAEDSACGFFDSLRTCSSSTRNRSASRACSWR